MNTALLVMAHGSPRDSANDDVRSVIAHVRAAGRFATVEIGYLECNEPTIPQAVAACAAAGATHIVAVPYFLHTGKHVADDLPTLLEAAQQQYPQIQFSMSPFLGTSPLVAEILLERAIGAYAQAETCAT